MHYAYIFRSTVINTRSYLSVSRYVVHYFLYNYCLCLLPSHSIQMKSKYDRDVKVSTNFAFLLYYLILIQKVYSQVIL